jgi:uncharacterized membrane protein
LYGVVNSLANRIPFADRQNWWGLFGVPAIGILVFLALPWSVAHKAHLMLHGLCAQNPSHTYAFGGQLLPFDARMTGIYTGYLVTTLVLAGSGASKFSRPPSASRILILTLFGGAMAVDGFNSTLNDLGGASLYEPRNWLRLTTGTLAGVVLGVALCFLTASSVWRQVDPRRQTLDSLAIVGRVVVCWIPIGLIVITGWPILFVPMTLLLIGAALLALTNLALVIIVILRRQEFSFGDVANLGRTGVVALLTAGVAVAILSIARTVLERSLGAPPLS